MPTKETVHLNIPVIPKLDKKATANLIRDIRKLEQELNPIKTALKDVTSKANSSVQELRKLSSAVDTTSKKLKRSLDETNSGLKKASKAGSGGGGGNKKPFKDLEDGADSLEDAFTLLNKSLKSQRDTTDKVTKAQERFQKGLKNVKFEHFNKRVKHFSEHFPKIFEAGKGGGAGARHVLSHGWEALRGPKGMGRQYKAPDANERIAYSRTARGGRAGTAAAGGGEGGLGAIGGAATGALLAGVAVIVAFAKVLEMASQSQVKLNKALVDGTGTARDFGLSADQYHESLDTLRNAIQDSTGTLLKFGGTSEQTSKIVNSYMKEATGSIAQTVKQMEDLGGGKVQEGVLELTKASMAYGKALGIGAEESSAMMGKFTTDLGYGAQGSIDLMGNIVKAAATANMPMTKFMSIFHQVLPDVELYQNRLEELTATVKLLSKTMSAKDIQNFTNAFARGFKGTDFKQRLKTYFIAGEKTVSGALKTDFEAKAKILTKNLRDQGLEGAGEDIGDEMQKAMAGGTKTMAAFMSKMQARASSKGTQLAGATVSDAMKLAANEADRRAGGLKTVTAMRGAGMIATYKIIKAQSQAFTKGYEGLSEHVIKQTGITEDQYDALRTMDQTLTQQRSDLKVYGKTNSKSMNAALRQTIAMRKHMKVSEVTAKDMAQATEDDLLTASEMSNNDKKANEKALELGAEQYNVTASIGDKIDSILAFLLEQILRLLNPLVDAVNEILTWIMGGDKKILASLNNIADKTKSEVKAGTYGFTEDDKKHFDAMIDSSAAIIKKGVGEGKTRGDLARSAIAGGALDVSKIGQERLKKTLEEGGMDTTRSKFFSESFADYQKGGKSKEAENTLYNAFQDMGGDTAEALMKLVRSQAFGKNWTKASEERFSGTLTKRPGAKESDTWQKRVEKNAADASDVDNMLAGDVASIANIAKDAAKAAEAVGTPANMTPATAPSHPDYVKPKDHLEIAEDNQKQLEKTGQTAEEKDYQATSDLLSLMKKGVKFEQSWMGTKFKNVLKESTLESFSKALLEFSIIEAKIKEGGDFASKLTHQGWNVLQSGQSLTDLANYDPTADPNNESWNKMMGYANGGPVDYDQIAKVHGGEFVVPRGGALVKDTRGGGGKVVNINGVVINVQTDATAEQIAEKIHDLYKAN